MFKLLTLTKLEARVRMVVDFGKDDREWTVDMQRPGTPGAIIAKHKTGEGCTIGMFRTRDGTAIDPDYAKLRNAVTDTRKPRAIAAKLGAAA